MSRAAFTVNMGNSLKTGTFHIFPGLSVTGGGDDKGYAIRFKFSRPTMSGDEINLPGLPNSNWIEGAGSSATDRQIYINGGATASELQAFLRTVQIALGMDDTGQDLIIWNGSDSATDRGFVHYNPDNGHWYEHGGGGSWLEAYNNSLDKSFSGLRGYLATLTSVAEKDFLFSITQENTWLGGLDRDIRSVQDPVTGKLSDLPDATQNLNYWYWAAGDEWTGNPLESIFYDRARRDDPSSGVAVTYPYTFWKNGEPNNWEGKEFLLHTDTEDGVKKWSDNSNDRWYHYYIEYSGEMKGITAEGVIQGASVKHASINGVPGDGMQQTPLLLRTGETLTYTITAANISTTNTNVVVRDTVPQGLIIGAISDGGTFNPATREIVWNLTIPVVGSLVATKDVSFTVTKETGATNLMINRAYVITDDNIIVKTNRTYHAGEPKLKRISYQYMACPGSEVEIGFEAQAGVSYRWFNAATGGSPFGTGNSITRTMANATQSYWVEVTYNGEVMAGRTEINFELAQGCGVYEPAECAAEGTLLFKEDFGGNNVNDTEEGPALSSNLITYKYETGSVSVGEGNYIITKRSRLSDGGYWEQVDDHTYPNNSERGYMLQVNAAWDPGQFYAMQIDGLRSSSTLYFSTWITSLLNWEGDDPTNMIFILEDQNGNVVAKYYTGDIPDKDYEWKQYGFEFTIPDGQTSLKLRIINNGTGSSGNDFVMDDIEVRLCVPGVRITNPEAESTSICVGESPTLDGWFYDRDNVFGATLEYRWEWSETGDISDPLAWEVVNADPGDMDGITGTISAAGYLTAESTLEIHKMKLKYNKYYRFVVANPESIDQYFWRAMSRVVLVKYIPCLIPLAEQFTACPGASVTLGFEPKTGTDIVFKWYTEAQGGTPVSTGNNYTVIKDNTGTQTWYVEISEGSMIYPTRFQIDLEQSESCGGYPVGCAVDGTLLFREDFGGNDPNDPDVKPEGIDQVVGYTYNGKGLNYGTYGIRKQSIVNGTAWYQLDDHTYPDDLTRGYLIAFDAAAESGQFYEHQIDNLCADTKLYFSAWIASVCATNATHKTNVVFILEDLNGKTLAAYYTGNVPDQDPTWKQYGFEFIIPDGQSSVVLKIMNNGKGTSGNDFVMDDIEIRLCVPEVEITKPVANDTIICSGGTITIEGNYNDPGGVFGDNLVYQWEWSNTGDVSAPGDWNDVTGTNKTGIQGDSDNGTVSSVLTITNVQREDVKYYRLVVGNSSNIGQYNCRAMSRIIKVNIYQTFEIPDIRLQVCPDAGIINLTSYIDTLGFKSVKWSASPIMPPVTPVGIIDASNFIGDNTYTFKFEVELEGGCSTPKGTLYARAIKDKLLFLPPDTVVVCRELECAGDIQLNRIMGVEAGGTWVYDATVNPDGTLDNYVSKAVAPALYQGAYIFDSSKAWRDTSNSYLVPGGYNGDAGAKRFKFRYVTTAGSCLGDMMKEMVIIVTDRM